MVGNPDTYKGSKGVLFFVELFREFHHQGHWTRPWVFEELLRCSNLAINKCRRGPRGPGTRPVAWPPCVPCGGTQRPVAWSSSPIRPAGPYGQSVGVGTATVALAAQVSHAGTVACSVLVQPVRCAPGSRPTWHWQGCILSEPQKPPPRPSAPPAPPPPPPSLNLELGGGGLSWEQSLWAPSHNPMVAAPEALSPFLSRCRRRPP